MAGAPVRVAVDLMGGDAAPGVVADAVLLVAEEQPDVELLLVGQPELAELTLRERGAGGRFVIVPATQVITMDEDPARAIRSKRDASLRVAARLVRDGVADATVSAGSTGAAMAAAVFTLGRLPGMTRPALAVTVPARDHPVVLLDVGANVDVDPALLARFALVGTAYATAALGVATPRVGLLSIGEEVGKGDAIRKLAFDAIADLALHFVGNVEAGDVALGGPADVIVTDGFTGNVLLKGMEGAVSLVTSNLPADIASQVQELDPDRLGGAALLGVRGVSVVAHGSSSPRAIASAIAVAAQSVRQGLVERTLERLGQLVARRREQAGLGVGP